MSFSLDLSRFADRSENEMKLIAKKVFIGLSTAVIKDTPVDTGRAINNWMPDLNNYSTSTTENTDKSGKVAISNATKTASTMKLGDTMTMVNNLPYIQALEYGWSKKAPDGFLRINLSKYQKWVRDATK